MSNLNIGLIGNCQVASFIDERATMVWACMPQFDSDPVFCRLLRDDRETDLPGFFEVELINFSHSEQAYQTNTAILDTILYDTNGGAVRITDVAPRYQYVGRVFTPMMLLRRIRPESGAPRIRIRLRPARDYGANACSSTHGSNHITYLCSDTTLRLTTDASLTHVIEENAFVLDRALQMEEAERRTRMDALRARERSWDVHAWVEFFLGVLERHRSRVEVKLALEQGSLSLPPLQRDILETVREHGTANAGLLLRTTGANRNTLKDNLRRMVDQGVLKRSGQKRGTRYRLAVPGATGGRPPEATG